MMLNARSTESLTCTWAHACGKSLARMVSADIRSILLRPSAQNFAKLQWYERIGHNMVFIHCDDMDMHNNSSTFLCARCHTTHKQSNTHTHTHTHIIIVYQCLARHIFAELAIAILFSPITLPAHSFWINWLCFGSRYVCLSTALPLLRINPSAYCTYFGSPNKSTALI